MMGKRWARIKASLPRPLGTRNRIGSHNRRFCDAFSWNFALLADSCESGDIFTMVETTPFLSSAELHTHP